MITIEIPEIMVWILASMAGISLFLSIVHTAIRAHTAWYERQIANNIEDLREIMKRNAKNRDTEIIS